jgi:hypothetical protein
MKSFTADIPFENTCQGEHRWNMKIVVLYLNKYPSEGEWYALADSFGYEVFTPEHLRKGQKLRYEQGDDYAEWMITGVFDNGRFEAIPFPPEEGGNDEVYDFRIVVEG